MLLGPWCTLTQENLRFLENREYLLLPSPFPTISETMNAVENCNKLYEFFLVQITESLNKTHGINYPERYWRVLLGPWLIHFIGVLYERYRRIEAELSCHIFDTAVLPINKCILTSLNTNDFINMAAMNDYYNLQLFSVICREICPDNCYEIDLELPKTIKPMVRPNVKKKIWSCLESIFYSNSRPMLLADMYHITPTDQVGVYWDKRFKDLSIRYFAAIDYKLAYDTDCDLRNRLEFFGNGDKFSALLAKILPKAIPLSYIEHYESYSNMAEGFNIKKLEFFGSAVGWYGNESLKYLAAKSILNGTQLLDFQHGGGYGFSLSSVPEHISLEKDIFFTWGWALQDSSNKTIPLPSPHLSRLKDKYRPNVKNPILIVGTSMPPYHYRFDSALKPDDMPLYIENRNILIKELCYEVKSNLAFRPYRDYGWRDMDSLKRHDSIKIANEGSLIDWMMKSKMVIIDHPHTSFLEALTMNIPTILYWDHSIYVMRPEAEPYFQRLRDAGILYKDPQTAAVKVNEICHNPFKWWLSETVQQVRREFCERFALSSCDWKKEWADAFGHLLKKFEEND